MNVAVIRQIPLSYLITPTEIDVDSHKDIDIDLVSINATDYPESPFVNDAVVTSDGKLTNPTGMIIDVVELLAERFHFKINLCTQSTLHILALFLVEYSTLLSSTSYTHIHAWQYIDMAAGPISFNEPRSKVIHQLGPFMYLSTALAGAKSSSDNSMFKMFRPFHFSTWIAVTFTVLLGGSLLFILNRYSPFCAYNLQLPGASPDEILFTQNLWSALSGFLQQGCDIYPLAFSGRALLVVFWFTTVALHATWQADMTAFMTRKWIPLPITSLHELAYSQTYQPFAIAGSSIITDFATAKENPVMQELYHKLLRNQRLVETTADAISLLLDDPTMIFLHDKHVLEYFFNRNCNAIQMFPVHFGQTPSGFAVAPGREFEQPFTDYLIHLYETGSIDRLFKKWWFASEVCSTSEAHYQPMALKDLMGAFIILTVALAVSLLVLSVEFVHFSCLRQFALRRKHRRVADNTANCDEPAERRRSAMMLNVLPEATANSLRYAGRKRASRVYNASVIDLQFANQ
ncbi:putative ATP synthase F0 A subunit [Paragonimus heterotremus]|uniref:Putative ATP synthase F0 A subunit n=1 Tax=Paragonimus heterotremus TaxID=100268 RepID=A0A8J4TLK3_9TREM|nr:putative ATP synthase F0 A subunit [Paragonimus heterotremus]